MKEVFCPSCGTKFSIEDDVCADVDAPAVDRTAQSIADELVAEFDNGRDESKMVELLDELADKANDSGIADAIREEYEGDADVTTMKDLLNILVRKAS